MSILRKKGKEKLRFRNMDRKRVTTKDFDYLKRLFLECLRENDDIEKRLDLYYKRIQVCFFYEQTNPDVEKALRQFLESKDLTRSLDSSPAFARSRNGLGCIMVFLKHLMEYTKERKDIEDIRTYHKNGIFEELCHLVEHKGDSGVHPRSYWTLWNLYRRANLLKFGNEIISQLDTDRNHYEVYLMMLKAYPKEWIERYWRYFKWDLPAKYERKYEHWKQSIPINVVLARLITDTLRTINVLYVVKKVPKEKLFEKHKKLLNILIKTGKLDMEKKRSLIERDIVSAALKIIIPFDESVFRTPEAFFSSVIGLWKRLFLV